MAAACETGKRYDKNMKWDQINDVSSRCLYDFWEAQSFMFFLLFAIQYFMNIFLDF